jgi:DNA-binding beta-propeller fold protein YncE
MLHVPTNSIAKLNGTLRTVVVGILILSMASTGFGKKKPAPLPKVDEQAEEPKIDTSTLVWPKPPDIPRIRWVQQFTGESAPATASAPSKQSQKWMKRLAGINQIDEIKATIPHVLVEPYGVAVDSKGHIYVADTYVGAVFIFNTEADKVEFIHNGKLVHFEQIIGLAIDDNDRLFVSDSHLHCVFVFDSEHRLQKVFGQDSLDRPSGIALDIKNRVLYVADPPKNEVAVFDADNFKRLRTIGGSPAEIGGEEQGTFARPTNVAVDASGNVYVADTINNRIQIFDANGDFVSMFGRGGDGPGFFGRPKGLAVDSDGHIWVADTTMDRVQVFDRAGRLAAYFGLHGTQPGQFILPTGVAIDKFNRVIVSEQFKGRIQVFRYVTDAEAAQKAQEAKR